MMLTCGNVRGTRCRVPRHRPANRGGLGYGSATPGTVGISLRFGALRRAQDASIFPVGVTLLRDASATTNGATIAATPRIAVD